MAADSRNLWQALERFLDEMMQPILAMVTSGQLFRVRVEELYRQARARISGSGLEVLTSGSGEFLIGDVPALTILRDQRRPGVLGGTALDDAQTVVMPLGPHHAVALAKNSITAELKPDQVDRLNRYEIDGALESVYLRPGSGLEKFARSIVGSNGTASGARRGTRKRGADYPGSADRGPVRTAFLG